jgi:hypothetical protein
MNLVATYSVMKVLLSFATFGGGRADRARPKSQTCSETMSEDGGIGWLMGVYFEIAVCV